MNQKNLRTYQRRSVTRESGYHTCEETTGGECLIIKSQRYNIRKNRSFFDLKKNIAPKQVIFKFKRNSIILKSLFGKKNGILAFGGYIYPSVSIGIEYILKYNKNGSFFTEKISGNIISVNDWNSIGFHKEIDVSLGNELQNVEIEMIITAESEGYLDLISFDFDTISKEEFLDETFDVSFHQKTSMHIPYLYYLNYDLRFEKYLISEQSFSTGQIAVLKSCNRCGRFLPININNEMKTLSFSLHCKKLAPCKHSTFRAYTIMNDVSSEDIKDLNIEDNKVVSYYGHQLECKACKKFFVNMPLNPQRNAQQFKEDGLRRRAIEVLINHLLNTNLIHFEFENKTKKEFSEYIWKKFDCKCFKCKKTLLLNEMHLDHTRPLAYLYRLDETATCLCEEHNSKKSDHFPVDFYNEEELKELSQITGLSLESLKTKEVNNNVLQLLIKNIVWFYDEFLMQSEYQKVRDGILTANKINDSLKRVIGSKVDLVEEYKKRVGHYPTSVTII